MKEQPCQPFQYPRDPGSHSPSVKRMATATNQMNFCGAGGGSRGADPGYTAEKMWVVCLIGARARLVGSERHMGLLA